MYIDIIIDRAIHQDAAVAYHAAVHWGVDDYDTIPKETMVLLKERVEKVVNEVLETPSGVIA